VSSSRQLLEELAGAVADGDRVDWGVAEQHARHDERPLVRWLREIASASGAGTSEPSSRRRPPLPIAALVLLVLAVVQTLAGVAGLVAGGAHGRSVPGLAVLALVACAGSGAWLLAVGRSERRAFWLGSFLLILASALARGFMLWLSPRGLLRTIAASGVAPDAFLAWSLAHFARELPRLARVTRTEDWLAHLSMLSAGTGIVLVCATVVAALDPASTLGAWGHLRRGDDLGLYWGIQLVLCLAALAVMPHRGRLAEGAERLRVRLFLLGGILGSAPALAALLVEGPTLRALLPSLLVFPATAAYAVLAQPVMDVGLVLHAAARRLLAPRHLLALLAVALAAVVIELRGRPRVLGLVVVIAVGLVVLRARGTLVRSLDAALAGITADVGTVAAHVENDARQVPGLAELARAVVRRLERDLGLESATMMVRDREGRWLDPLAGPARRLPLAGALATVLREEPSPVGLDPEGPRSLASLLPEEERLWALDGNIRLVIPLPGSRADLVGLVALGPRLSEAPFTAEEQEALRGAARGVAGTLEERLGRATEAEDTRPPALGRWRDEAALECGGCGRVHPADASSCPCGGAVVAAGAPYLLAGRFRLEHVLGRGRHGVVYRAIDEILDRTVAVKTLPRLSAEAALRLRREAQRTSALDHPHVAALHGALSWRGHPLVAVEYLAGGTLADALRNGRWDAAAVVSLGRDLAEALGRIHGKGMLHRDVKPSNIGFTAEGVPKLLDLGLADWTGAGTSPALDAAIDPLAAMRGGAGGALYLPPEASRGVAPGVGFDFWGLCLVLYEALAGEHPLRGGSVADVLERLATGAVPDVRRFRPECPAALAELLGDGLCIDAARRPTSAAELAVRLAHIARGLEARSRSAAPPVARVVNG
jgi:hypothetical protein